MDITKDIPFIKQLRKEASELVTKCKALENNRERNIAIQKFQEGTMWLGMMLKRIHDINPTLSPDPYPNSKDPSTGTVIDNTAEELSKDF